MPRFHIISTIKPCIGRRQHSAHMGLRMSGACGTLVPWTDRWKLTKKLFKKKQKKQRRRKNTSLPCDENDLTKLLNLVRQKTFFFLSDHVYPCGWEFTGARPPIASSCFKHYRKCLEFLSIKIEKGERVSAIASDLVATASTNIRRDEAMAWCQIWYVTLSDYRFCR